MVTLGPIEIDTATALVAALAVGTLGYSLLSGLYGVAWSDVPQFALAMLGSVILAVVVVIDLGGPAAMLAKVDAAAWAPKNASSLAPSTGDAAAMATAIAFFTLNWWAKAPGHGALAQRLARHTITARRRLGARLVHGGPLRASALALDHRRPRLAGGDSGVLRCTAGRSGSPRWRTRMPSHG